MIYVKFWGKVHELKPEEASEKIKEIKHREDLEVIESFNRLYDEFLHSDQTTQNNKKKVPYGDSEFKRDSESSQDEAADDIEAMSKYLDKLRKVNNTQVKPTKKLNPYAHAQSEYKKSRTVSKRLNTLSIFVKKDIESNKYQDAIFDDDNAETGKGISKLKGRK